MLSPSESALLEFLTAVETGRCRESLMPTDGLIAEGYIVPVDGRVCLTMAGIARMWSLREQQCANQVLRLNSSQDPGLVASAVHCLRCAGELV